MLISSPSSKALSTPLLLIALLLLSVTPAQAFAAANPSSMAAGVTPASHFDLANYRGQLVYLDFWASWCGPCKASFPWMKRLQSTYQRHGLKVVAVSVDQEADAAERFLATYQPNFEIVADPNGTLAKQYELLAMPSSYLISPEGKILWSHKGFRKRDQQMLEEKIQASLKAALAQLVASP